jgi:hypothetical protein
MQGPIANFSPEKPPEIRRRKPLLPRLTAALRILFLFFSVSLLHLHPLIRHFFSKLPYAANGDVRLSLAILNANVHKLIHLQFDQLYHLPFLFPLSHTLTIGFTLFGQSLLLSPFFFFSEPNFYALYNGITVFSYLAAGIGAYLFFRELQDNRAVSLVAACLYIVLPFRVYNIPHLSMMFNFPIPFAFFFLLRYLKHDRKRDLVGLNCVLFFQFLSELSLGFFLSVALAFFVLFYVLLSRPVRLRSMLWLSLSLLPNLAAVVLIHAPFLNKALSLSPSAPVFDATQYHPALSFFVNKSSLLLLIGRSWDPWPLFPGFSVACFFYFAFSSYIASWRDRILLALAVAAYVVPAAIAIVFFRQMSGPAIAAIAEIGIVLFCFLLGLLLLSLRKKSPLWLTLMSLLLLAVAFITFEPFPRLFDFFNALARFFPFLNRSRGLRTLYILPLAILGVFSLGLNAYLARKQNGKKRLWLIVLVLFLEHVRWPVAMARLPEASPEGRKIYRALSAYPDHFGVLELPFVLAHGNTYPLFTRYHDKHTYHGHYLKYDDPLDLKSDVSLQAARGYPGLQSRATLENLKACGIYLIVIDSIGSGHAGAGRNRLSRRRIKQNIQAGMAAGLIKEVRNEGDCVLLVIDDGRFGRDITYPMPFFALTGKATIRFRLRADGPTRSRIYFNGILLHARDCPGGEHEETLAISALPLQHQINRLRIVSDRPLRIEDVTAR